MGGGGVIIMPANVTSPEVRGLMEEFPGMLGNLFSPGAWQTPHGLYALDNGRFSMGSRWTEGAWLKLLDRARLHRRPPEWVLCPDTVGDWAATQDEWWRRISYLRSFEIPVAIAVQDGATVDDVDLLCPNVVFVGGTTEWKWSTAKMWCDNFPRVHIARVNTVSRVRSCFTMGAESVDGTGWMRTTRQRKELRRALEVLAGRVPPPLLLWSEYGPENR